MRKRICTALPALLFGVIPVAGQRKATITVFPDRGTQTISRELHGQFAEHLGRCVYGGLWVGPDSPIPNTDGYRNDVLQALKDLHVPVLRWPGGCFADEYHWQDGIGPVEDRPGMVNSNWGGTVEDNSFGTHEFLNLCEILGCEPYVSGNVGSGSVEELAKWVEYMTAGDGSPMAELRKRNGRERPWSVKYIGIGNESWGCGGNMRPEYYADLYRRYSTYCRNFNGNRLYRIASGASDYDYNWTEVLMREAAGRMDGISLHYYTVTGWSGSKGSATEFSPEQYYWTLGKCLEIEDVIRRHMDIMDTYDPEGRVGLLVDEWGTWWDVEPGTNPGHLYQQNTLRDAFVAALTLDVLHKYARRVRMANIAQIANVLQSMVLTSGDSMVLTPTYHVFEMYKVHQGATYLPVEIGCDAMDAGDGRTVPVASATASRDAGGIMHVSLSNVDLEQSLEVSLSLGDSGTGAVTGRILTSGCISDHNTFDDPHVVEPRAFDGVREGKDGLVVTLPPMSMVTLEVR